MRVNVLTGSGGWLDRAVMYGLVIFFGLRKSNRKTRMYLLSLTWPIRIDVMGVNNGN